MPTRRARLLALAFLIPVALAGLVYAQQTPSPLAQTRLPDGRLLTLDAVTHGHGPQQVYSGTRWQRWLGGHVQPGAARLLGVEPMVSAGHPVGQDPDQLTFWVTVSEKNGAARPNRPSPYSFHALLLDDDSCPYTQWAGDEQPVSGGWSDHFRWWIWPRRSAKLRLRLFTVNSDGKPDTPAAEWVVPNPAPLRAEVLSPRPTPVAAEAGPLHVVLTRLERIPPPAGGSLKRLAPQEGLRAVFRAWENGRPAPDWRLSEVVLTDPTGNIYSWGTAPAGHYHVSPQGELVAESYGTIPPHEHGARLTVRLAREADLYHDVVVSGLPLPQTGPPVVKIQKTVLVRGEPIHFERVTRVGRAGKAPQFSIEYSTLKQSEQSFHVQEAVDQSRTPLKLAGQGWTTRGDGSVSVSAPATSRSATLTLRPFTREAPRGQQQAEMVISIPAADSSRP